MKDRAMQALYKLALDPIAETVGDPNSYGFRNARATADAIMQCFVLLLQKRLCDAVTGQKDGKEALEALERDNLFVVPLDDERQWYRYHHLFAEVLRAHLMEEQPHQVPAMNQRASAWYKQNNLWADAIHHAFAAKGFEQVAELAELAWQDMDSSFQSGTWLGWINKLPDELIRTRPVLSTQYAWALLDSGDLEASESRLQDAERLLAQPEGSMKVMVVVDKAQFRPLPSKITIARAQIALIREDFLHAAKYAEQALKLTPENDTLGRAQATVFLGMTYWASGDLQAAQNALTNWIKSMEEAGNFIFAIASGFALADVIVAQGHLKEAIKTYQHSLQLAAEHDEHVQRVTAHHYLGLAMLYHEMGDEAVMAMHFHKAGVLGKQSTLIDWPYRWHLAQARLKEAEGDLEAALNLLDEAKRVYVRNPAPDSQPTEALKARVFIKQGKIAKALAWVHERGLSIDDDLSCLREFEHITLARALIAEYGNSRAEHAIHKAMGLLTRLQQAAEEGKRMGSVIEILTLQALAYQAIDNLPQALSLLQRALMLAEAEGFVRIFINEGVPMAQLLSKAAAHGIEPDYTGKLLAAFADEEQKSEDESYASPQPLIEPLSQRELEVLQLIAQGLSNREISERLFVALNTVKGHNRNIFGKLQVQRRTEAVARARELGLL